MARLHEYQGKALLGEHGIHVPRGRAASSAAAAREITEDLGCPVVLKAQAWVTGRKAKGGVVFADDPDQAASHAEKLLSMSFGNFPVTEVLVEEAIDILCRWARDRENYKSGLAAWPTRTSGR